jgi:hypothetical protein
VCACVRVSVLDSSRQGHSNAIRHGSGDLVLREIRAHLCVCVCVEAEVIALVRKFSDTAQVCVCVCVYVCVCVCKIQGVFSTSETIAGVCALAQA